MIMIICERLQSYIRKLCTLPAGFRYSKSVLLRYRAYERPLMDVFVMQS